MRNAKISRLLATMLIVGLLVVFSSSATFAANEFTGMISLDTSAIDAPAIQTIVFTPMSTLADGDTIILTYPDSSFDFAALAVNDISATQTDAVFGTEIIDSTAGVISIPVTTAGTGAVVITVGATNKMTNPSAEGQYLIHIAVKTGDGDIVEQTGFALAAIANTVSVTAIVAEVLIFTLDTTSDSPKKDFPAKTVLAVKTNSVFGYKIQAKFSGAENKIEYIAHDFTASKSPSKFESDAAARTFATTFADLISVDGTAGLRYLHPTNAREHTIYYVANGDELVAPRTIIYVALPTF